MRPQPAQSHVMLKCRVLSSDINVLTWESALALIGQWAERRQSSVVCICNAHSLVTAQQDDHFRAALSAADLATPDGAPVAWMMRRLGYADQERINGPDLMWKYCRLAAENGQRMFLYGSTDATLAALEKKIRSDFPSAVIVGRYSPPFRPLSVEEDESIVRMINQSEAQIVWVSLGCPKQEVWMNAHKGRIHAVMIGVGAAFDFHAGVIARAPRWVQNAGFEWLHRVMHEPRRLWRRYLVTNTLFVASAARQLTRALISAS